MRAGRGFLEAESDAASECGGFFSLLYACLLIQTHAGIDVLAKKDGPIAFGPRWRRIGLRTGVTARRLTAQVGSTDHTFLVGLCFELLGGSFPNPPRAYFSSLTHGRDHKDGGFSRNCSNGWQSTPIQLPRLLACFSC